MGEHGGDEMMGSTSKGTMQNVVGLGSDGVVNFPVTMSALDSNNKDNVDV